MELRQFPDNARDTLLDDLLDDVSAVADEEDLSVFDALAFYSMDLWGLTSADGASRSDGKGDRGIDWYRITSHSAEIWQFKGADALAKDSVTRQAVPADLADLRRILDFIETVGTDKPVANVRVRNFQSALHLQLRQAAEDEDDPTFYFTVKYSLGRRGLTKQANDELQEIKNVAARITELDGVLVEVTVVIQDIDSLLAERWRQNNDNWRVLADQNRDWIEIEYSGHLIDDTKAQIMFCRGIDLVRAYSDLGHRLFAPNVRCYLEDTPVNTRIRESVRTARGIDNFRYMNNGVTIVCENVEKRPNHKLRLRKPGVINGLQTIRALHAAYGDYASEEFRSLFAENLYVLARVFGGKKHGLRIDDLIIATNNQNKMEPRNLRSNTPTQVHLEGQFAKLNWFYERKERAWEAFAESDGIWDTLPGKKPVHFGGKQKASRRNVDNEIVATSWLAFCGYSDIARNEKRQIFQDDKLYARIFETMPALHGFDYEFKRGGPLDDPAVRYEIPDAGSLLLSALIYQTAKHVIPSAADNRRKFVERLAIGRLTAEEQNVELSKNPDYLAGLMVSSSPFLLTELYGYLFFAIDRDKRAKAAKAILDGTDISAVFKLKNYGQLQAVVDIAPGKTDVFRATHQMLATILSELAESEAFRTDLLAASSRPSFMHSDATRRRIIRRVREFDESLKKWGRLEKPWSAPFDERGSVSRVLAQFA